MIPRARGSAHCNFRPHLSRSVSSIFGQREPWQTFLGEKLLCRFKSSGVLKRERADMKMYIRRAFTFACQGGPAPSAETAQPARGRIEPGYLPLDHGIGVTSEYDENRNGRAAMLAATLTMAPRHPLWFTIGDKSHGPAKTPALGLVAHLGIPCLRLFSRSLMRKGRRPSHLAKPCSNHAQAEGARADKNRRRVLSVQEAS